MLAVLSIVLLAAATACLPVVIRTVQRFLPKLKLYPAGTWLPLAAAGLMLVSVFLPDIHISNQTTTFQQHFVGGGLYAACLYAYAKRLFGWRMPWWGDWLLLFGWVSALGVANELAEFCLVQLRITVIDTGDTDWDLLANTLGGIVGYSLVCVAIRSSSSVD